MVLIEPILPICLARIEGSNRALINVDPLRLDTTYNRAFNQLDYCRLYRMLKNQRD